MKSSSSLEDFLLCLRELTKVFRVCRNDGNDNDDKLGNESWKILEPNKNAENINDPTTNKRVMNVPMLSTKNLAKP